MNEVGDNRNIDEPDTSVSVRSPSITHLISPFNSIDETEWRRSYAEVEVECRPPSACCNNELQFMAFYSQRPDSRSKRERFNKSISVMATTTSLRPGRIMDRD